MTQDSIRAHIEMIRSRISEAAERAGRDANQVTLLGACKQVETERVLEAIALGIGHVGENQVQEAEAKFKSLERPDQLISIHLIGHLQTNKVRRAVALFDVIQTVDSIRLAERINKVAGELNRHIPTYIQVNLGL